MNDKAIIKGRLFDILETKTILVEQMFSIFSKGLVKVPVVWYKVRAVPMLMEREEVVGWVRYENVDQILQGLPPAINLKEEPATQDAII